MSKNKYYGKKKVHVLHNNENITTQRAKLESIYKEGSKSQAFANIRMEGQTANILVKCNIDSGAEVNVMPQRVFKHMFSDNKDSHGKSITLQKSKVTLSAYGGAKVKQFGCFTLLCTHNDITLNIECHVTEDNGSTMLGLQSCISMRLISLNCENKSGELRICLDPKDLNTCVRRPHHCTQVLEDILPQLQGASVFTILDARSGYWNVKLDDESKLLTTFNTPYGRYCFRRLPFGLISAQYVFQKKVDQTFEDLPGVIAIADDIVVFDKTEAEHDKHLDDVMKRTQQVGLCLTPTNA